MEFKVVLTKDIETGWLVAEVPNLPGCISQGKTKAEALQNIKDAIKGYLASLKKHPEERVFDRNIEIEAVSVN
ncbi:type II toxin-antitoxin system HicB family antitoxin [Candidatus Micrarchaeota archaeon]|nr:type II toxin-antitoxin system HicB family antitoxin [Candidatus Micrarchaeota archaeon]MBU1930169.1 type II toxin-antitoxin system HicB family antitoxin [Candidatus Micrarchaeota archaeon]